MKLIDGLSNVTFSDTIKGFPDTVKKDMKSTLIDSIKAFEKYRQIPTP
jgi:hypothetical protein